MHFDAPLATDGSPTGRCLVIVTPDAERTMCTYLGAGAELDAADVDAGASIASAAVTYLEGYLWDEPRGQGGDPPRRRRSRTDAGRRVALTLSDPFCVERHRAEFRALIERDIDILFANEHEITMLYEVDDFDEALHHVARALRDRRAHARPAGLGDRRRATTCT